MEASTRLLIGVNLRRFRPRLTVPPAMLVADDEVIE
jgi:hypothetical protein